MLAEGKRGKRGVVTGPQTLLSSVGLNPHSPYLEDLMFSAGGKGKGREESALAAPARKRTLM